MALTNVVAQETAAPPAGTPPAPAAANAPAPAASDIEDEEVVTLSPFVVDATRDIGYYAENTLAGSRLNAKVSDLAAAITVVTKQQMTDTASTDINDVFLYEANTEGVGNFTRTQGADGLGVDRSTIKDVAAGYGWGNNPNAVYTAATANRVRGVAAPEPGQNYYPSIGRIPWDSYNTATVEINRGPNAVLFGLGSPAGIVNQSTTRAALDKDSGEVELRVGSWDSYRGSFSFNKTLIADKLALFGAALYDDKGFQRKPSNDTTRRQYLALTFQPWKKTRILANYENYDNHSRRPNYLTPRDFVSPWRTDGRPVFDPVTRMVTYLDTGVTKGPYLLGAMADNGFNAALHAPGGIGTAAGTYNATTRVINNADNMLVAGAGYGVGHPLYVKSLDWTDYSRAYLAVYRGEGEYIGRQVYTGTVAGYAPPAPADRTAADWELIERRTTQSSAFRFAPMIVNANGTLTAQVANYVLPSVTDKSVYNWEKVNVNSMNFGESEAETVNIEIEQEILSNLHLQLGWFHQEMESTSNYVIGQQTGATLFVDTNTNLTDGSPNPYFGMPYVSDLESDTYSNPEENDSVRATLAYELDLTKNDGWTRWLGRHRLMGLWTKNMRKQFANRSRFTVIPPSDPRYISPVVGANYNYASRGTQASRRYFYLGDADAEPGKVTRAAGYWANPGPNGGNGPTEGVIPSYNWTTRSWEDANVTLSTETWAPGTGGSKREIDSLSGALQSYFWDDRIVATLGWRRDDYRSRVTPFGLVDTAAESDWYENGFIRDGYFYRNAWGPWQNIEVDTMTRGVVVHALRWADNSHQLSFHYNESDNFTAPQSATYDFLLNPLATPGGDGKDYGVSVNMFDNKLIARLNWFETTSTNERVSNNLLQRTVRFETAIMRGWAEAVVRYLAGEDITNNFANATLRPLTADQLSRMEQLTGLPNNWPNVSISDTQDLEAKGLEFQLIYNPKPNWNIKFTGGKQDTKYSNTNGAWENWINGEGNRYEFFQNLRVPQAWIDAAPADRRTLDGVNVVYGNLGSASTPMSLTNFWSGSFGFPGPGDTQIRQDSGSGWTTPSGYWQRAVDTEIANARQFEGRSAPNQRKWRWNILTNYQFTNDRLKAFTVGGAIRWEDKAIAGYYGTFDRNGDGTVDSTETVMERSDLSRPITVGSETHLDLWLSYTRQLFSERVGLKVQLNVRDALEEGGLLPVHFNLDGSAAAFRIVDPRQISLTTTFTF